MARQLIFIINPLAGHGRGKSVWETVQKALNQQNEHYEYFITHYRGHTGEIVHQLLMNHDPETLLIVAVGGDGTVHEISNALTFQPNIPVGYIPAGSGNDFARGHDIAKDPLQALERILTKRHAPLHTIDIGVYSLSQSANHQPHFVNGLAIGFDGAVTKKANESKFKGFLNKYKLGGLSYPLLALKLLSSYQPHKLTIAIDGKQHTYDNTWLVAVNNIPFYGGGIKIVPHSIPNDGIMNVCIIHNIPKWKILFVFAAVMLGAHQSIKGVTFLEGADINITSDTDMIIAADGEIIGTTPIHIAVQSNMRYIV
ncbi:diacylglycerol kinase [Fictibacillus macauensis ZFHKF-1]|uniref:Diacylglycerol kinase n=1 Tax=Fictibacillus macauensis ZFHKF-1 TaxID=1196324 RepID=I8UD66_9BACL|nr:diacylglycerol kinase family protein [Fictibacillus macauensis]EIT84870.1 diacylglycerol kinase [Fictibacillus macauensis ZFHKF-1]